MQFGFHNNNKKNGFGLRYIILMVVVTAMFGALVLQLANLQLRNGQEYYDTAESRKMKTYTLKGERGMILDRNGIPTMRKAITSCSTAIRRATARRN